MTHTPESQWNRGDRVRVAVLDGTKDYQPTGRYVLGTVERVRPEGALVVLFDDRTTCTIGPREALRVDGES